MSDSGGSSYIFRVLFPTPARIKLAAVLLGSILVSLIETGSILLLLPLMELLSGSEKPSFVVTTLSDLLGQPPRSTLIATLVGVVLGGFVIKDVATLAFRWWVLGFTNTQLVNTSTHMLDYFLYAPYETHLQRTMADMMRSMSDSVAQFYTRSVNGIMSIVTELVTLITIMGALLVIMPLQTLAMVAYFGLAGVVFIWAIKPKVEAAGVRQLEAGKEMFEATIHSFGGIKEIKIRHAQPHFTDRYRRAALVNAHANRVNGFLGEAPKYLLEVLFILGLGAVILITAGTASSVFGTLAVLAAAAFRVLPSLTRMLASTSIVRSGEPARKMLFAELRDEERRAPLSERHASPTKLPFRNDIVLDGVSFRYDDAATPVLSDVSFTIPAGSSVALVGGSGAGKTTLANILMGLHRPTSGRILVDGVDISTRLDEWQNNIAFVPQDVFHMDLPFGVNIAFDRYAEDVDPGRLAKALEQAQLTDLVQTLPHGLDTTIGDRGVRLSGGQRQRIGIARALYRQPTLLILDEATSALDNETERKITETISSLHGEITIVVIAHRLSTVKDAEQIVLLSEGRVAAVGSFAELAASSEEFSHLVTLGALDGGLP